MSIVIDLVLWTIVVGARRWRSPAPPADVRSVGALRARDFGARPRIAIGMSVRASSRKSCRRADPAWLGPAAAPPGLMIPTSPARSRRVVRWSVRDRGRALKSGQGRRGDRRFGRLGAVAILRLLVFEVTDDAGLRGVGPRRRLAAAAVHRRVDRECGRTPLVSASARGPRHDGAAVADLLRPRAHARRLPRPPPGSGH